MPTAYIFSAYGDFAYFKLKLAGAKMLHQV
jgi:hypothetical protein